MAEKQYGGTIPVNLTSVIVTITSKMDSDRQALAEILLSSDLTDFMEQTRLLQAIQAAQRAIHVLSGETDIDGERVTNGLANQLREKQGSAPYQPISAIPDNVDGNLLAQELSLANNSERADPTDPIPAFLSRRGRDDADQSEGDATMDEGESPTARRLLETQTLGG